MKKLELIYIVAVLAAGFNAFCGNQNQPASLPENFSQIIKQAAKYQSGLSLEPLREIESVVARCKNNPQLKSEIEAALESILANPLSTIEAKKFACQQLSIIGPTSSLKTLGNLASIELTSGLACMAIVNSPSKQEAASILESAYPDGNLTAKIQILNAIGNLRSPSSIQFLKKRLAETQPQIVESALFALGKIGIKPAEEVIFEFKNQGGSAYQVAVSEALLLCAEKAICEHRRADACSVYEAIFNQPELPFHIKRAAFLGLVKTDADRGVKRIETTLAGKDQSLKPVAISLIPYLKGGNISSRFSKLLSSLTSTEQALLVEALASRGDAPAIKTIQSLVPSQDPEVKYSAISALGNLGNENHVAILVKALSEANTPQDSKIVENALHSLKGGEKTDLALINELKKASAETKVRIINVLSRRYALSAIPALLQEAGSSNPAVSRSAFKALSRLCSDKHLQHLVNALVNIKAPEISSEAQNAVSAVIEKSRDKRQCEKILCGTLEKTTDVDARVSLISLLPVCGGQDAFKMAKSAYSDTNPKLKEAGLRALCEWQDISVWQTLVSIYENPDSESFRVLALRGLTRLLGEENIRPDVELVSKYNRLLKGAKTESDKKLILGTLSGCHHPEALYLALEMVNDPNLKSEAIEAVRKIATAIQQRYPKEASEALAKIK